MTMRKYLLYTSYRYKFVGGALEPLDFLIRNFLMVNKSFLMYIHASQTIIVWNIEKS